MNLNARLVELPAFVPGSRNSVHAIVDTPQGSRNKFKFNPDTGLFELGGAMPAGAVFPFEFGFIPSTLGGDGDHLDLLILLDAPTFVGCVVRVRLIGVIVAEQTERSGKVERNDRLIAVAEKSRRHEPIRALRQLPQALVREIEHFFVSYNHVKGKEFKPRGRFGPARALKLVREGIARGDAAQVQMPGSAS